MSPFSTKEPRTSSSRFEPLEAPGASRDPLRAQPVDAPDRRVETENSIALDPLMTVAIEDRRFDLKGWVVIHSLGDLGGCGGLRCAPDVSLAEVKALARAMTYKYSFFKQPMGGAKGGLVMDFDVAPQRRRELVSAMGQHVRQLLHSRSYHAWSDINFSAEDVGVLYRAAGMPAPSLNDESSRRTARSTFASIVATAEALGIPAAACRVGIEGIGSVGGYLASEIVAWGGKVVAASNVQGAIANAGGCDVPELLKRRQHLGSQFVREPGDWRNLAREELFEVEMDILVPCARVGNLDEALAQRIRAKAVVPAANVPCTPAAEEVLAERGIQLLPDFVVNAGGILGAVSHVPSDPFFMTEFKQMLDRLLARAFRVGIPPIDLARQFSEQNYAARPGRFFQPDSRWKKVGDALRSRNLMPDNGTQVRARQRQHLIDTTRETFAG